jgi:hypothetical protein
MVGLDAIATVVGLCGMFDDACVPDVCGTELLDLLECFRSEVGQLSASILSQGSSLHWMFCLIAKEAWQYLVYDDLFHNQFTIHN